jgi:RNA recognition motif-containing protein
VLPFPEAMLAQSPQLQPLGEDLLNINAQMEAVQDAYMSNKDGMDQRKLVVLGLPWETTEETFRQYFQQFGNVEVRIPW